MTEAVSPADHRAPSKALWFTDLTRGFGELSYLPWSWPVLSKAPRGDGHPVLVLPGLGASDRSTAILRRYLRYLGYRTYSWRLGTNLGPTARVTQELPARLQTLSEKNDTAVSIIGWSLGGIFARRLARRAPESVRQVITLGSPIRLRDHQHTNAGVIYRQLERFHADAFELPLEAGLGPLPVPATSIYSRLDGIAGWRSCLDERSESAENIEVRSAHFGLGWHPAVLYAVADRLAQSADAWRPFQPPAALGFAYPEPRSI